MHIVKTRSLSVSAATFPKPTYENIGTVYTVQSIFITNFLTDVIQVIVKYNAVTYIVFLDGPFINSGISVPFVHNSEYGCCVIFANFHNQLYCTFTTEIHYNY